MADITLGDYAGYIFLELVRAREMADAYSRAVAERYRQDEILQHFSVPRFKVPKMDLTVPVLISGARYTQLVRFGMALEQFTPFVRGRVDDVIRSVQIQVPRPAVPVFPVPRPRPFPFPTAPPPPSAAITALIEEFHHQLAANTNPLRPDNIVTIMWAEIFRTALEESNLTETYEKNDPDHQLLANTTRDVTEVVQASTIIDRTNIDSLLINPETNVVKNGSSDSSVFTIQAELVEEGFFIRSVKDPDTGAVSTVVEFE